MQNLEIEEARAAAGQSVHKFEVRGLGLAPFRFVGMTENWYQAVPDAPKQPGSSCDYCHAAIGYEFWCLSRDGKRFKVGSDCIHKYDASGLRRAISAVERAINRAKREGQVQRENVRIEAMRTRVESDEALRSRLAALPLPCRWPGDENRTVLSQVEWDFRNCGHSGRMKAVRWIERIEAGK